LFAYGVFKVIYAPKKAFKEIIQNPTFIGPLLIMILFVAANTGSYYALLSKEHYEQTVPTLAQGDVWTENRTYWNSTQGVTIGENALDFINGSYYGNKSIEFSAVNSNNIMMMLNNVGPVNCSSDEYDNVSLRIKWTSPAEKPENATFYLFSSTEDCFYYNLTRDFTDVTVNVWNNFTIPLATEKWLNNSVNTSWSNITDLKLEFKWPTPSNITVLVDALFFRGVFKTPTEDTTTFLSNSLTSNFVEFGIRWALLGLLLYVLCKILGAKITWKPTLILAAFALVTMFVQAVINIAAFATLPNLYYPLEWQGGTKQESAKVQSKILAQTFFVSVIYSYVTLIVYLLWTIVLFAIATRTLTGFSWSKSALIASIVVAVPYFLLGI
jgi:hypothetical protein